MLICFILSMRPVPLPVIELVLTSILLRQFLHIRK